MRTLWHLYVKLNKEHGSRNAFNDMSSKQIIIGKCKLCPKTAESQYSHIIPELFYKYMYDDKGRALKIEPTDLKRIPIQ